MESLYWTRCYRSDAILNMMAAIHTCDSINPANFNTSTIIFYTENDTIIDIPKIKDFYNKISSRNKKIINIKKAKEHVIARDIKSPDTTGLIEGYIIEFINSLK